MAEALLAVENDYRSILGRTVETPSLRVAVVIPVYNRVELLEATIAGVSAQTYPSALMSLVIADDGSEEDVGAAVSASSLDIEVTVVRREHEGYGAGQARNLGAEAASDADVIVFFDADCIPDSVTVERHAVWHHLAANLVVIGSRHHLDTSQVTPDDIARGAVSLRSLAFGTKDPATEDLVSSDYRKVLTRRTASLRRGDVGFRSLVSSNFSVRREDFVAVGGFSEDFARWGGEDTELGWRLWNEGAFFVDEARAVIYHQTQEDAGAEGWRQQSRSANDGLIQTKIPHRHYRRPHEHIINEVPKVSVIIHSPEPGRLEELTGQILGQRLGDLEIIVVGTGPEVGGFVERRHGDPRTGSAKSTEEAIRRARGEFVAIVHGSTALDHRLLSRSVAALERKPNKGWVRTAYGVPTHNSIEVYRTRQDTERLDQMWNGSLPLFGLTRRRELMKGIKADLSFEEAWNWVTSNLDHVTHVTPLVIVPAEDPMDPRPETLQPPTSLRSMVLSDLKAGGRRAVTSPLRAVRAKTTGAPYRPGKAASSRPVQPDKAVVPTVRYVGWTGRHNLGDEAMLAAVGQLFPDMDIETTGDRSDLLMLGGGTLINRGYLRHLRPLDSPRIERVTFGTGVANPAYWGDPRESTADWIDFLDSCMYVGVRGPLSATLLTDWGLKRSIEITGDPALSLEPHGAIERVEGRVVVCPAWSNGLLWGGSDREVLAGFAGLVKHLRAEGHEVWALSAFPGDDSHIIEMMRDAGAPDLPYLAAHDDPAAALSLLASAELVVSERLHGAILAAATGTVPVMVEHRPKLRDFAASVGLDELVIRTDELEKRSLIELAPHAYEKRAELTQPMMARVDKFRSLQRKAALRIQRSLGR